MQSTQKNTNGSEPEKDRKGAAPGKICVKGQGTTAGLSGIVSEQLKVGTWNVITLPKR